MPPELPSDAYERLIRLESEVFHLRKDFDLTARIIEKRDVKMQVIHDAMIEAKGGLRILLAVAAAAGGSGGLIVKYLPMLLGVH